VTHYSAHCAQDDSVRQSVAHHRQTVAAERYLRDTADDAPDTRSERMFTQLKRGFTGTDLATGRRRGLRQRSPRSAKAA
jgi:hypothetical protein